MAHRGGSPSISRTAKFDSLEEALSGILKDSPSSSRAPFQPVKRQASAPNSPLASKVASPQLGNNSPLCHETARFPSNDYSDVYDSPSSRVKAQVAALATPTAAAPIQVRAKLTPAANVRRKPQLAGAERADPPASVSRHHSYTAPRVGIISSETLGGDVGSVSSEWVPSMRTTAGKDNVLVCIRVRPAVPTGHSALSAAQKRQLEGQAHDEAWKADTDYGVISPLDGAGQDFRFDAVVTGSGNASLYSKAARNLVLSSCEGFDACVFAYGQTASGKTFALTGTPANPGIIPQAVADVFGYIRSHPDKEFLLRASFLEIYNENLVDLLAEAGSQPKIRQDADKRFFVSPLHEEIVTCEAQVAELQRRADKTRHTSTTDFNARSSRSHTLLQLVIESRDAIGVVKGSRPPSRGLGLRGGPMLDDGTGGPVTMSRLTLVDLAGSEKATSQAERRIEGAFINRSLLTLEKVISALTDDKAKAAHIPYRDSKLTQLLQPSLSGEARVAVICTINPSVTAIEESKSTLKFAARVKKVVLHAERREIVDDKALIHQYRAQIARLEAQLANKNAETQAIIPPTPRSANDETLKLQRQEKAAKQEAAVKTLQQQIEGLNQLFLTAKNVDKKRDVAPIRHVSLEKPAIKESKDELQEQLLDLQDRLAESEDMVSRLKAELQTAHEQLGQRPEAPSEPTPAGKDRLIAMLSRERQQLEIVLAEQERETAVEIRRVQRAAEREWLDKVDALKGQMEAKEAIEADLREKLDAERKRSRQLESYSINVLRKQAEAIVRPRHSSMDTRGRFSFGDADDLPSIVDEVADLEFLDSNFMSRLDLAGTAAGPELPRRRVP